MAMSDINIVSGDNIKLDVITSGDNSENLVVSVKNLYTNATDIEDALVVYGTNDPNNISDLKGCIYIQYESQS